MRSVAYVLGRLVLADALAVIQKANRVAGHGLTVAVLKVSRKEMNMAVLGCNHSDKKK